MEKEPQELFSRKLFFLILGAIFGAALPGVMTIAIDLHQKKLQRASLKASFAGEIQSLVKIVQTLEMKEEIQRSIDLMKKTGKKYPLIYSAKQDYFQVYKANVPNLGLLDATTAKNICIFYTNCFASVEYINQLNSKEYLNKLNLRSAIKEHKQLIELLKGTEELGDPLVGLLTKK